MFIVSTTRKKRSNLLLHLLAITTSLIARFTHTVTYLIYYIFLFVSSREKTLFRFFLRDNYRMMLSLVMIISVYLPASVALLGDVYDFSESSEFVINQSNNAGGIVLIFKMLDDRFLFFVSLIPKVVMNYIGNVGRIFDVIFGSDKTPANDIYNKYVVLGHQLCMLLVLMRLFAKKISLNLNNRILLLIAIYTVIHCSGYLINYRIFFPVYCLFALIIASPHEVAEAGKLEYK